MRIEIEFGWTQSNGDEMDSSLDESRGEQQRLSEFVFAETVVL